MVAARKMDLPQRGMIRVINITPAKVLRRKSTERVLAELRADHFVIPEGDTVDLRLDDGSIISEDNPGFELSRSLHIDDENDCDLLPTDKQLSIRHIHKMELGELLTEDE